MGTAQADASLLTRQRQPRELTAAERKVHVWIRRNHGVLSRVARELHLSVQWVQRVAYGREAQSRGYKVERALAALGCPLVNRPPR